MRCLKQSHNIHNEEDPLGRSRLSNPKFGHDRNRTRRTRRGSGKARIAFVLYMMLARNFLVRSVFGRVSSSPGGRVARLSRADPDDPPLDFPYSSQAESELREVRCHYGRRLYRIL